MFIWFLFSDTLTPDEEDKFCSSCGARNSQGSSSCSACGKQL